MDGPAPPGSRRRAAHQARSQSGAGSEETVAINLYDKIKANRERIIALAARRGASNARVFGSVARGEADEKRDVDFLVDMEPGRSLLDLAGLLVDLEDLLGCGEDVATTDGLKERIRERVLREAVPV